MILETKIGLALAGYLLLAKGGSKGGAKGGQLAEQLPQGGVTPSSSLANSRVGFGSVSVLGNEGGGRGDNTASSTTSNGPMSAGAVAAVQSVLGMVASAINPALGLAARIGAVAFNAISGEKSPGQSVDQAMSAAREGHMRAEHDDMLGINAAVSASETAAAISAQEGHVSDEHADMSAINASENAAVNSAQTDNVDTQGSFSGVDSGLGGTGAGSSSDSSGDGTGGE